MRSFQTALLLPIALLAKGEPIRAQQVEEARAVIEKAIKAYGGKDVLAKGLIFHSRVRGIRYVEEAEAPFDGEYWYQWLYQTKLQVTMTVGSKRLTQIAVLNGMRGWERAFDGKTRTASDDELKDIRGSCEGLRWGRLFPLLEDKDVTLSLSDEIKVDGRSVVGVRIACKKCKDTLYYFDRETNYLVKGVGNTRDRDGKDVIIEQ